MTTKWLVAALAFSFSALAGAEALKFTPISATSNYCYVVLDNNQNGYFTSDTYDLTGLTSYNFSRTAFLPANPNGGYAWQAGDLNQTFIQVVAHAEPYVRASVSSGASFKFRTSATKLDVLTDGTFMYNNYMDSNVLWLRDRTTGTMLRYLTNYTGYETVRITVDPTHEFDVYVATNHNNIYQGGPVGTHVLHGAVTVRVATNYLNGMLTLQDVVPVPMADRLVSWSVIQDGNTVASGAFPSMGSSPFQLPVDESLTGPATLVMDTISHVKRSVPVVLGDMNVQVGPVALINGDVDSSGEVDAADIDTVIANFGSTEWGVAVDADLSGEVDAADIDIVIANFGAVDN